MSTQPKPIVDVFITVPEGFMVCRRFVFDLPTGHQRSGRGLFVKVGHAAIPVTTRSVRAGRITISHFRLVNVPVDASPFRRLRKAQ